jgi:hypothetical protein
MLAVVCKSCRAEMAMKRKYGLTIEQYNVQLVKQNGVCAICKTKTPGNGNERFAVDHDHITGSPRGLLCISCNNGLGAFKDNVEYLQAAIHYLEITGGAITGKFNIHNLQSIGK